jgi:hypothetical protein
MQTSLRTVRPITNLTIPLAIREITSKVSIAEKLAVGKIKMNAARLRVRIPVNTCNI